MHLFTLVAIAVVWVVGWIVSLNWLLITFGITSIFLKVALVWLMTIVHGVMIIMLIHEFVKFLKEGIYGRQESEGRAERAYGWKTPGSAPRQKKIVIIEGDYTVVKG